MLQQLNNCPVSYLANSTDKVVDTDHGEQLVGSALAYHVSK